MNSCKTFVENYYYFSFVFRSFWAKKSVTQRLLIMIKCFPIMFLSSENFELHCTRFLRLHHQCNTLAIMHARKCPEMVGRVFDFINTHQFPFFKNVSDTENHRVPGIQKIRIKEPPILVISKILKNRGASSENQQLSSSHLMSSSFLKK